MRVFKSICILAVVGVLTGCNAISPRTSLSVDHYNVKGNSFKEIEKQIIKHGPKINGKNAIAGASIQMIPQIYRGQFNGQCRVISSNIRVKANVTLPHLTNIYSAKKEIRTAFRNLQKHAELHEAIHVAIADNYAKKTNEAIRALKPMKSCDALEKKINATLNKYERQHNAAHKRFDELERKRAIKLASSSR